MEFKIEKNIEMQKQIGNRTKYPWRKMEIGDSFLFNSVYSRLNMVKASNNARNFCAKSPDCKDRKHAVRKTKENGIRIWRIK